MAPPKKFTDEQLKSYLAMDFTQSEIARMFRVEESTISKRVASLEKHAAVRQPAVVQTAVANVFDTRTALEENYRGCMALLSDLDADPVAVRALVLKHIQAALTVVEKLYQLSEQQAFQEEVLAVLDECEPGSRQRILKRLQERRTVRAAFAANAVPLPI